MIEQKDAVVCSMTYLTMLIPKKKRHAHVHVYDDKGKNLVPKLRNCRREIGI